MTRPLLLLLALFAAACSSHVDGTLATPDDPIYGAVWATARAWEQDGSLGSLDAARCDVGDARIVYQTEAEFRRAGWCPLLPDGTCGECAACKSGWLSRGSRRRPRLTVYLAPGEPDGGHPWEVVTQATRFFGWCTGMAPEDWHHGRRDPRLWGPGGVRDRAAQ